RPGRVVQDGGADRCVELKSANEGEQRILGRARNFLGLQHVQARSLESNLGLQKIQLGRHPCVVPPIRFLQQCIRKPLARSKDSNLVPCTGQLVVGNFSGLDNIERAVVEGAFSNASVDLGPPGRNCIYATEPFEQRLRELQRYPGGICQAAVYLSKGAT